jgi:cyclase
MSKWKVMAALALVFVFAGYGWVQAQSAKSEKVLKLKPDDYEQIQQLYANYSHYIDQGKGEQFADLFTDDGEFGPTTKGRAALIKLGSNPGTRHVCVNISITPTADGADTHCYLLIFVARQVPSYLNGTGIYNDHLVKTPEGWKFKKRMLWRDTDMTSPYATKPPAGSAASQLAGQGGAPAAGAPPPRDYSKIEIKTTQVASNIYMLQGQGGNITVCTGDDGVVMVDSEFSPLAAKIKAAIKAVAGDKPIRFLINTHSHPDHFDGNAEFASTALIIAQDNVRKVLEEGRSTYAQQNGHIPKEAMPVLTFTDRITLHLNGEDIRVIHIPDAHTDGDSVIYFPHANVVSMGDIFVTYGFPIVDQKNGGHVSNMVSGLEQLLTTLPPDVKVIPGHGDLSNVQDVRKYIAMLRETRAIVAQAVQQGKTLDQMKADHILAKYDDYSRGVPGRTPNPATTDKWTELLYAEVTNKN